MILSDRDIKQQIQDQKIIIKSPRDDYMSQVHASSMDLRLGSFFRVFKHSKYALIDPRTASDQGITSLIEVPEDEQFIVQPGEFVLGVTMEKIGLPDDLVARVEGRSSLGRLGIVVHSTAGFIDAGFFGTITLEISNLNRMPIALHPGMRICQLAFEQMTSEAEVPYHQKASQKYQGQELPQESLLANDPEFK
ncbi:MAG: dCTP deaminase [Candidatus Gracilibacteria bacterium]|jgi:dCTP deaminase|nr:dCTP deaminase [Candidatus Gracilibacteria bacterium]